MILYIYGHIYICFGQNSARKNRREIKRNIIAERIKARFISEVQIAAAGNPSVIFPAHISSKYASNCPTSNCTCTFYLYLTVYFHI